MNEIVEREHAAGRLLDDIDLARPSPAIHAHIKPQRAQPASCL
jgi:hypothetical protein